MPKVMRRRRREAKTDYKSRLAFLKSGKPRLVVRKTNRYIIAQIVESDIAKDITKSKVTSKELLEKGWPKDKAGSLKSLVAAYLTGYLIAKKVEGKTKEVILDTGLQRTMHGSRLFAVVKGASEAGLVIAHNEKALPSDERLSSNEKTSDLLKLKEKI